MPASFSFGFLNGLFRWFLLHPLCMFIECFNNNPVSVFTDSPDRDLEYLFPFLTDKIGNNFWHQIEWYTVDTFFMDSRC